MAVTKARPGVSKLPNYVFNVYLPTLLWGTIMDAWITNDPILTRRALTLNEEEKKLWRLAREKQAEALLPKAMLRCLVGHFSDQDGNQLRSNLEAWRVTCASRKYASSGIA